MNNRRIGKLAVTAIVGIISAISGIASMEMIKSLKKETASRYNTDEQKKNNPNVR